MTSTPNASRSSQRRGESGSSIQEAVMAASHQPTTSNSQSNGTSVQSAVNGRNSSSSRVARRTQSVGAEVTGMSDRT